ncbi:WD40-repeat-containing domain protein [Pholiota molesta]|nr:WD40-repeat-containing domain protein [Pholiota molesta]
MLLAVLKKLVYQQAPLLVVFKENKGPIIALAISPDGKILASGEPKQTKGSEGIAIWDLDTKKKFHTSQVSFYENCQISSLCWIGVPKSDSPFYTLVYGNAMGYLIFLQRRADEASTFELARGEEILHITTVPHDGLDRVAIGTRDKCVQILDFDATECNLISIHSKAYDDDKDIIPKVLAFDTNHDLLVFSLYDGGLYSRDNVKTVSQHRLQSQIGNAAVDLNKRLCIIDNVRDGFDLYHLDTGEFLRTFPTGDPKETYPKGVSFADRSRAIVGGSDHGSVYIFHRKTGRSIDVLKYGRKGGVETIAAHDCRDGTVLIAAASASNPSGSNTILVWKWHPTRKPKKQGGKAVESSMRMTLYVFLFALLALICGYGRQFIQIERVGIPWSDAEEHQIAGISLKFKAPSWALSSRDAQNDEGHA